LLSAHRVGLERQDDATRCVVAEHLVRREGHSIGEALSLARSDVEDSHLRGIVRFASALGDRDELDRLLDGDPVRIMSRQESIEAALLLFASATIHAIPPPAVAEPIELDDVDDSFGPLVGRCGGCDGPTYFGHGMIAIGWPEAKPRWETITPNVVADARKDPGKSPVRGSKIRMLRDGDLPVLCTNCTMRMKHADWVPPQPPTSTTETIDTDSTETADGNGSANATVAGETVGELSDTATVDDVTVAGRERAHR
jgi:hypothetical protein